MNNTKKTCMMRRILVALPHISKWSRFKRHMAVLCLSLTVTACALVPQGMERDPYSAPWSVLLEVLFEQVPELRHPTVFLGNAKKKSYGSIIIGSASVATRAICDRSDDPTRLCFAIAEDISTSPEVLAKIRTVITDPCPFFPALLPEQKSDSVEQKLDKRKLLEARVFFGCGDSMREVRNVHFFVVSDIDRVLLPKYRNEELRRHIVDHFVIQTNSN
jgi:hypothetical protein